MSEKFIVTVNEDGTETKETYKIEMKKISKHKCKYYSRVCSIIRKILLLILIGIIFWHSSNILCKTTFETPTFNKIINIIYMVLHVCIIVLLCIFFVKDNSCLKFAKLDELHEITEKLLGMDINDSFDKTTKESEPTGESGNNNIKPEIVTEKSNIADLIKHYMTCITEL